LTRAGQKKKIVVVGGGPAGMEVARLAAVRGHDVTLHEKQQELGGQVLLAARLPGRDEIGGVVRWQILQLEKAGVEVITGSTVTADAVVATGAEAVVVATGASYLADGTSGVVPMPVAGWDGDGVVVTPESLLVGDCEAGATVVVLDGDGHVTPLGVAELLASRGSRVTIVSASPMVGHKLVDEMNLPYAYARLAEHGVEMLANTWAGEIRPGEIELFNVYAPAKQKVLQADTVVMAAGRRAHDDLYFQLEGRVPELHRVGDCVAPGDIGGAILSADSLGRSL
jgi:NADPH-dependent 2,4-dienoyl-CoA reductase/sulfur reductase-like enzyme